MNTPERGFYYHYKRNPEEPENVNAYEVVGTSMHTEDQSFAVLYRPLYENTFLKAGYFARPLDMFMEYVPKGENGAMIPRFKKIEDAELIARLKAIRNEMYPKTEFD